jgi:large subunit ribosomal protein L21
VPGFRRAIFVLNRCPRLPPVVSAGTPGSPQDQAIACGATGRDNMEAGMRSGTAMTFAVIKTGGKQYKVAANDVVKIEKIDGEPGEVVTFDQVLMVGEGDDVTVGTPLVEGALVAGHFLGTKKSRTVIILKKERRQHYDRRNGHRQRLSSVRITEILTGGGKPTIGPDEKVKARALRAAAVTITEPVMHETVPARPAAEAAKPARRTATKAETAPVEAAAPAHGDDVKMIGGVGPALEKKLAAAGVTTLTQIAAWTAEDVARLDAELDFKDRIEREEWVEQARELIAGKPPRAKSDQDAATTDKKPAARRKAPAPKSDVK